MKFKNQEDQKALELLVDELVQSADRVGESSKDYCEKEKRILLLAKDILKYHWVQVQHGLSVKMGMLIVLFLLVAIILWAA
jgi:histone H3/H4